MNRSLGISSVVVMATTWLAMVAHSVVLMLDIFIWQARMSPSQVDLGSQIAYGLANSLMRPDLLALSKVQHTYDGAMPLAYLLVVYGPVSMLWTSSTRVFRFVPACLVLAIVVLIVVDSLRMTTPLPSIGVRLSVVVAVTAVAVGMERVRTRLVNGPREEVKSAGHGKRRRIRLGFTLVEVLVVIAILLVLAAISLAVYGRARKSAYVTREINQVRQVYLAVNLYEADYDGESPAMLEDLNGTYLDQKYLTCPTDERLKRKMPDWPANPWINIDLVDPPYLRQARSPVMNSYLYLKTFESRFSRSHSYLEYRSSPDVGLVAGVGLLECGVCKTGYCVGNCEYWTKPGVPEGEGHPPVNMFGDIVIARTDGSIHVRKRPDGCPSATLSHLQLFLDGDLGCDKQTPVTLVN